MTTTLPTRPDAVTTRTARGRSRTLALGPFVARVSVRSIGVCVALGAVILVLGALALSIGDFDVPIPRVIDSVLGRGTTFDDFIVRGLRLPRLLTGLLVGAALGIGGGLFQSLSRNPLGSPDIVGFDTGAATGALVVILVWHSSGAATSFGAVIGGVGTALVVYLLAVKRGVQGYRLVLVGIGIGAMLVSVNDFLITRADLNDAQAAQVWIVGSLNGRTYAQVVPIAIAVAVLLLPALWIGRDLRMLELGDDTAQGLGVRGERTRLLAVVVGVGLTAIATACAGPISFIALAAPQVAKRLTDVPGPNVIAAALTGAVLLTSSDFLAQHLVNTALPVGAVTGAVGGVYLSWLLTREWRRGSG